MITKSEAPELFQAGTTQAQLTQRLGPPMRSTALEPPQVALALWEADHRVSVLLQRDVAISQSVFPFKGRRDKDARVAQAGFDSFMTLGIAEIYLIPRALWERAVDETLWLTVWFGADGRAVAYRWDEPSTP